MWVAKFGFKWKIGNGRKVKFWENNWLGPSNLAIQHWDYIPLLMKKQVSKLVGWREPEMHF